MSTHTSAMPSSTKTEPCTSRLVRFPADRNTELWTWKMTTRMTRPPRTGSTPLSPLRMRFAHAQAYSPRDSLSSGSCMARAIGTSLLLGPLVDPGSVTGGVGPGSGEVCWVVMGSALRVAAVVAGRWAPLGVRQGAGGDEFHGAL